MKCYWNKNIKEDDIKLFSENFANRKFVINKDLRSYNEDPPIMLFDIAPENAELVLGNKKIMQNIFFKLPDREKAILAPMCKLWSKWFLFSPASPGIRRRYDDRTTKLTYGGMIHYFRSRVEVYSHCGCYDLRTPEEVNDWHYLHFPQRYGPSGLRVNEVIEISSDDEEVIEISSDHDDDSVEEMLICDEDLYGPPSDGDLDGETSIGSC